MGLIDYLSKTPLSLVLPASMKNEELVVARTTVFISKLEGLDNIVLNELDIRKRVLLKLIGSPKKESNRLFDSVLKAHRVRCIQSLQPLRHQKRKSEKRTKARVYYDFQLYKKRLMNMRTPRLRQSKGTEHWTHHPRKTKQLVQ